MFRLSFTRLYIHSRSSSLNSFISIHSSKFSALPLKRPFPLAGARASEAGREGREEAAPEEAGLDLEADRSVETHLLISGMK